MDSKIWIGIVVVLLLAVVAQAISVNAIAVQKCNSVKLNNITLFQCGKNVILIIDKMFAICRNGTVLVIGGVTNIREVFEKMEQIFDICSTYAQKSIKVSTKRVLRITST